MTIPGLDDLDGLAGLLEGADRYDIVETRTRLQRSLYEFIQEMWDTIEPDKAFVPNWHVEQLCWVLELVEKGIIKRLIINIPPGSLKSLVVSVFYPAWLWAKNPRKRILTAAYGAHLTSRDNLRMRDIIQSPKFKRYFNVTLHEDQNTKTRYNTSEGGWRIATSVGGVGTGEHPDLIIIDDALTAAQAESEPERETANTWFDRTISSRGISRGVAIIVIGQRLHEDDLPGYLLKKDREGWTLVCFPMRYEKCTCPGVPDTLQRKTNRDEFGPLFNRARIAAWKAFIDTVPEPDRCLLHKSNPAWTPDPLDIRETVGEVLMPQIFTPEVLAQLELDLDTYGVAGQLQQRPSPEGGGLFKMEYFDGKIVDEPPKLYMLCRGWDTAGTDGGGDWSAGVGVAEEIIEEFSNKRRIFRRSGKFFVMAVEHEQVGPDKLDTLMVDTADFDHKRQGCKAYGIREEKEGGSAGIAVVTARAKLFPKLDYQAVVISGSKRVRARPFRAQCAAGNVYIVRAHWNSKYLRELCGFPAASHDDLVDGSSTAYNGLVEMEMPTSDWVAW